ncbi:antA/AntB antirepressor family protein [Aneurinibacillus aneurinilyticus]|uniref:antA/AntB antirepressor family protein n=1 Tax=Aneurinibacillus aneurinilyticus TaxID=1391 RepID=UPI002E24C535|nr:antA/AntB antirepressor family protein [Aneurinibacillus aneurinilyticus]
MSNLRVIASELVPVYVDEQGNNLVNARELHEFLQVETRFNDWIERRIEKYGFVDGEDFHSFLSKSNGGRPSVEYILAIDTAKEISMVENNERGRQVRKYFIEMERRAKEVRNNVIPLDERQVRMQLLKSALEHEERIESVEQRLTEVTRKVEEQITLQHHEQYALQKAINRRVLDLANRAEFQQLGFDEQNYITPDLGKVKRKLYSQIHRSIKDCFAVASYRDIRRCDFEETMKYVQAWRPRLAA